MPAPVFSVFTKFKPRKRSANMLVFHNFHFAKNSKTSQGAAACGSQRTSPQPGAHGGHGATRMLSANQRQSSAAATRPQRGSPGAPLHPTAPYTSTAPSFPAFPTSSRDTHWDGPSPGDLWVVCPERGGDGGGRVLARPRDISPPPAAPVLPAAAAELPGSPPSLLQLILHSAAQYFIIHLSEMYISLLRALLE